MNYSVVSQSDRSLPKYLWTVIFEQQTSTSKRGKTHSISACEQVQVSGRRDPTVRVSCVLCASDTVLNEKSEIKRSSSPLNLIRFEGCERSEHDTDICFPQTEDKTLKIQFVPKSVSLRVSLTCSGTGGEQSQSSKRK